MTKLVKEAIKEFKIENQKQEKKQVYHNTRLLLRHYNDLQEHILDAVDNINQMECDIDIHELNEDDLYILSIKQSKVKTLIMLAHIDVSLEKLKQKQIKLGTVEKYRALEMFYFQGKTYEQIQEELHCGLGTPGRWVNQMVNQLSIYLFGIDGLKQMLK
ncbi:hypothetical protein KQI88_15865 [Alkaliphilus sp. MSJ-5]|uniref:Sigma-70, region 4 n=2 Tax=Alkaliphilus flagellatus TaxID=2841507 RepID=A0ABS6G681_9FIRM|nr:hypothetical protein [Alkaliphilus flagellatus]MBU5677894.1 hypothetical protein [Alkaliphilus flagellatus]